KTAPDTSGLAGKWGCLARGQNRSIKRVGATSGISPEPWPSDGAQGGPSLQACVAKGACCRKHRLKSRLVNAEQFCGVRTRSLLERLIRALRIASSSTFSRENPRQKPVGFLRWHGLVKLLP